MSSDEWRSDRLDWYCGRRGPGAFWLGVSSARGRADRLDVLSLAWGWDEDAPWSWLPRWRQWSYRSGTSPVTVVMLANAASWLGVTVSIECGVPEVCLPDEGKP